MPSFGRLLTAMATPMRADYSLDLDGAQRLAAHLVDQGNDGVVVTGTTGESPTLSHDETRDLLAAVVEAVGDRATVVAGCGKNDTAETVRACREAARVGAHGVLLVAPYYNKPQQRGLEAHFVAAAEAVDLPVLLYNIPSRTAIELAPETILAIAERAPNVRGVKDSVANFAKSAWITARAPSTFELYAGDDVHLLPLLAVGGVGVVSVAGHLVGEDLAAIIEAFPTDPGKALALHRRLLPLFAALFAETNPVPLKAALNLLGLPAGPVRPPLADASDATVAVVRAALDALGRPAPAPGGAPAAGAQDERLVQA